MIDWDQVKQLEEDIGAEDFGDVVEIFIAEVDEAIDALPDVPADDGAQLAPALHFLKGSAYNLGFKAFGDYCSEGEAAALAGSPTDVSIPKVMELYAESKTIFMAEAPAQTSFSG